MSFVSAPERRQRLEAWINERPQHSGLTTQEIIDVSGLYDEGHGRWDRCHADLKNLARDAAIVREGTFPARWCSS